MKRLFFLFLCIIASYSCEEIISVPDITEENIEILAPANGTILESNQVTFAWEAVEFAEQYQIQVAIPNFENATEILIDELLDVLEEDALRLTTTLDGGTYQWRVRGINSSFETDYTTHNLVIDSEQEELETIDLSFEDVTQAAPSDGIVLDNTNVTFTWDSLIGVDNYHLQIAFPDFDDPEQVVVDALFENTVTSQSYDLEDNTSYQWRVQGTNDVSETDFSTSSFSINLEEELSEQTVVLVAPEDNEQTSETSIDLSWETIEGATQYRVIITDTANSSVFLEDTTSASTLSVTFELGTYTWAVRAENTSENSPFTTQSITIL